MVGVFIIISSFWKFYNHQKVCTSIAVRSLLSYLTYPRWYTQFTSGTLATCKFPWVLPWHYHRRWGINQVLICYLECGSGAITCDYYTFMYPIRNILRLSEVQKGTRGRTMNWYRNIRFDPLATQVYTHSCGISTGFGSLLRISPEKWNSPSCYSSNIWTISVLR